jgi:predicted acyl esterase
MTDGSGFDMRTEYTKYEYRVPMRDGVQLLTSVLVPKDEYTAYPIEAIEFTMPDVNHVFRRGHRVMVQVQSTWLPLIDRNPQTFTAIPSARAEDYRVATHRVMRSTGQPSGIEVMVMAAT